MRTKIVLLVLAAVVIPVLLWSEVSLLSLLRAETRVTEGSETVSDATIDVSPAAAVAELKPQVVTAGSQRVGATAVLGGTVIPYKEVTLTAQRPGRVVFLAAEEGDWFRAREILSALDKDQLLAQRAAAVANLRGAEAVWRAAQAEMWRQHYAGNEPMRGMQSWNAFDNFTRPFTGFFGGPTERYGHGIHRGTDVYAARQRADQAAAQIQVMRAQIEEINSQLRDSDSVAPFAGVITKKHVEVGDTVQPGQPLLRIADIRRLQLQLEVPARIVAGLRLGMTVPVKLDVGRAIVNTQVAQVFPMADPQRHTVTVKLDLPNDAPAAPGMYAEAMVPETATLASELPVVPASAVVWRGSLPAVYVLGRDNKLELRMVRVGERLDDSVLILSGVNAGEQVVVNPAPGIIMGMASG